MTAATSNDCTEALSAWLARQLTAEDLEEAIPRQDPLRMWWKPEPADLRVDRLLEVLAGGDDVLTLVALVHSARAKPGAEPLPPRIDRWLAEQLIGRSRRSREAAGETQFDAFLSYCHRDRGRVDVLLSLLRDAGLRIFFDAEQIGPGDNIVARLHAGMTHTRRAIIVVTAHYMESTWAQRELDALLSRSRAQELRLLPVLLDAVPLPPAITDIHTIDLRGFNAAQDPSWTISRLKPLIEHCRRKD